MSLYSQSVEFLLLYHVTNEFQSLSVLFIWHLVELFYLYAYTKRTKEFKGKSLFIVE